MGRIHGYPFTKVLFVAMSAEVPEFDDDTLVMTVSDDSPLAGTEMPYEKWAPAQEAMEEEMTRWRCTFKVPMAPVKWSPGDDQFISAEVEYFAPNEEAADEIAAYYAAQFDGAIVDEVTELG